MGIWPDSVFRVRVWPVRLALLICKSMHYVISVFLEMFLCFWKRFCIFIYLFFFGGERACLLTHAKVAGTRLPFSKYSGTVHAQMCCHPETKSKVHPRRKKSTLPGGLPSFAFQPVYKHLPAACNMALLLVVGFNEFDSLAFGHNEGDPLVLSTCGANPHWPLTSNNVYSSVLHGY